MTAQIGAGMYLGMPADAYHKAPGLSASMAWAMASTEPAKVRYQLDHPKESGAMALGTVTHSAILEGDAVEREYIVIEKPDLRTKAGKAEWAAAHKAAEDDGKTAVSQQDFDLARGMRDAVHAHPVARAALSAGRPEVSMFAKHDQFGVLRSREDWMPDGWNIVCDLKTARDAGKWFGSDAYKLGYHAKAHHYRLVRSLYNAGQGESDWPDYLWIVVESEPPHLCAVYRPDADMEALGEIDWQRGAETWLRCRQSGEWPGLPTTIIDLSPPNWARHRLNQLDHMGLEL